MGAGCYSRGDEELQGRWQLSAVEFSLQELVLALL